MFRASKPCLGSRNHVLGPRNHVSYPVEGGISSKRHISWPCSPPWSPSCRRWAARSPSSAECASASNRPSIGCQQTEMDSLNNVFFYNLIFSKSYFELVTQLTQFYLSKNNQYFLPNNCSFFLPENETQYFLQKWILEIFLLHWTVPSDNNNDMLKFRFGNQKVKIFWILLAERIEESGKFKLALLCFISLIKYLWETPHCSTVHSLLQFSRYCTRIF